jgi:hypothetical protein
MLARLMGCISVSLVLAAASLARADDVPDLNVDPVCRGIAQQAADPGERGGPGLAFARCVKSEQTMRQKLTDEWSSFVPADKANCIGSEQGGLVGGNAAGASLKDYDLGKIGNTIAGAIGGAGGGQILTALLPFLNGTAGNVDIGAVLGQAVGGGVAGAIVTVIVGLIKNATVGQTAK